MNKNFHAKNHVFLLFTLVISVFLCLPFAYPLASSNNLAFGTTLSGASTSQLWGMGFKVNQTTYLTGAEMQTTSALLNCSLYLNSTDALLSRATILTANITFNNYLLNSGTAYYILCNLTSPFNGKRDNAPSFPIKSNILDFTGSVYNLGTLTKDPVGSAYLLKTIYTDSSGAAQFVSPTPTDGSLNFSKNVILNLSCAAGNATIWFSNQTNPTFRVLNNSVLGSVNVSNYITNQTIYYYKGSCDNGLVNTSTRSYTYSVVPPTIILNENNFVNALNQSNIRDYSAVVNLTVNVTEFKDLSAGLSFGISIRNASGAYKFNYFNGSIGTMSSYNFTTFINYSTWKRNETYYLRINASDGANTAIQDYQWYLPLTVSITNTTITSQNGFTPVVKEYPILGNVDDYCPYLDCTIFYRWYRNGALNSSNNYSVDSLQIVAAISNISTSQLTFGDSWIFSQAILDNVYSNETPLVWYNSTAQTIYQFYLDNCSNALGIPSNATGMNFTGLYETNSSAVNISINSGSFITWNPYGLSGTNTFYPTFSNVQSFKYCIYPSWATLDVSYNMNYNQLGSTTTRQRSGSNILISNTLTTIPLYVLSATNSIVITLTVTDTYSNPIGNANVVVVRNIGGVDIIVQTAVTGDDGTVALNLDSTQSYTVTASKAGYTSSTKVINYPSIAGIYTMQLSSGTSDQIAYSSGISYSFSPSGILNNGTNYSFNFNLSSSYWNITNCLFSLSNGTSVISNVVGTFNSSNCNAAITLNTGNYTTIISTGTYYLNSTAQTARQAYQINSYTQGQYSFKTVLDDLAIFSGSGFGWQTKMFLAFIIIFAIVAVVSLRFNSLINPEANLILQCALFFLFSFIGWLTIPPGMGFNFPEVWGTVNAGQYALFVLDLLITAGYIIWRHA